MPGDFDLKPLIPSPILPRPSKSPPPEFASATAGPAMRRLETGVCSEMGGRGKTRKGRTDVQRALHQARRVVDIDIAVLRKPHERARLAAHRRADVLLHHTPVEVAVLGVHDDVVQAERDGSLRDRGRLERDPEPRQWHVGAHLRPEGLHGLELHAAAGGGGVARQGSHTAALACEAAGTLPGVHVMHVPCHHHVWSMHLASRITHDAW